MDANFILIIHYINYTPCLLSVYVGTMLLPLPKHLTSHPVLSEVGVPQYLVFCIVFYRSFFFFLFDLFLWIIALSTLFELRPLVIPLWYLQSFLS